MSWLVNISHDQCRIITLKISWKAINFTDANASAAYGSCYYLKHTSIYTCKI